MFLLILATQTTLGGDSLDISSIAVAVISLVGTLFGTFGGILTSAKLSNYRIEQLEKKVEKHNTVVERTYNLEGDVKTIQVEIEEIKEDVRSLQNA